MIQAKFKVDHVVRNETSETIVCNPVYSADKANPNFSWSQATPSGKLELTITNRLFRARQGISPQLHQG